MMVSEEASSVVGAVRQEVVVEASQEHAFVVFTQRCDQWWPSHYRLGQGERANLTIEPRLGGRWYETSVDGEECDWGVVLAWEPPARLVLAWMIAPGFRPESDLDRASRVEILFHAEGERRTRVTLTHSELERHADGWESMRDGVAGEGGWPGIMRAYAEVASS